MTIEQRLQHAARELREVQIDVPPLGSRPRPSHRSRVPMLVAPMLFAIGGLLTIGVVQNGVVEPVQSDIPAAPAPSNGSVAPTSIAARTAPTATPVEAPSVRAELQMIAEIISSNAQDASPAEEAASTEDDPPTSIGPS